MWLISSYDSLYSVVPWLLPRFCCVTINLVVWSLHGGKGCVLIRDTVHSNTGLEILKFGKFKGDITERKLESIL